MPRSFSLAVSPHTCINCPHLCYYCCIVNEQKQHSHTYRHLKVTTLTTNEFNRQYDTIHKAIDDIYILRQMEKYERYCTLKLNMYTMCKRIFKVVYKSLKIYS